MSNYRRLISYIYAYEGGVKGKNIGFAKIESRGIQCRITVNVKKIYVGSNDIGVYLLSGEKEILLGNIFIRGGCGEFRSLVSFDDVEHSGSSMDQCHGLTVHEVGSAWRAYTTIWEDAVAHAAEVELEEAISNEKMEHGISDAQIRRAMSEIEAEFPLKEAMVVEYSKELVPDAEVQVQLRQQLSRQQDEWGRAVMVMENIDIVSQETVDPGKANSEMVNSGTAGPDMTNMSVNSLENISPEIPKPEILYSNITTPDIASPDINNPEISQPTTPEYDLEMPDQEIPVRDPENLTYDMPATEAKQQQRQFATAPNQPGNTINPADMEEPTQEQIWNLLKNTHTKIMPFDYEHGCETLTIKPQDIGILPRESWIYGNNSFLLHGFYNFRYLIISKLENPMGTPYYMLGVPGHYYNNERYMASMFGFPEFVLSKEQPSGEDRFGYWYTFVSLGQ